MWARVCVVALVACCSTAAALRPSSSSDPLVAAPRSKAAISVLRRRDLATSTAAAAAAAMLTVAGAPRAAVALRPPEFVTNQQGFDKLPSGLQVKEVKAGAGRELAKGDRAVYDWEGYTIGYFGRPFEARNGVKGGDFAADQDHDRFIVGNGEVIPALEEGVLGMKEGGVRQLVFGPELGYPFVGGNEKSGNLVDPAHDKVGPKPKTFSGMRALNFVLENKGDQLDKTLLINVKLVRVDKDGERGRRAAAYPDSREQNDAAAEYLPGEERP